jgi:hypothetical protein
LVPYTYAQSLKAHREAIPPQRWTGWGYESDPVVWSAELLKGETQYWFGDALLIAGIYEPGVSSSRVYLPKRDGDAGYLNLSAPHQYLASGQWHEISSLWQTSIPVLARIGSAVPIGKTIPTTCRAEVDPEFPNIAKDDWRGVEIFPPPVVPGPEIPSKEETVTNGNGVHNENVWFSNDWLEDDGISPAGRADIFETSVAYAVIKDEVQVKLAFRKHGSFTPLWVKNGLNIVLPVNDERRVVLAPGGKGSIEDGGHDEKGRRVFKLAVAI